ncbi:glycosyl hydrolase family 92-domain-containing protein [Coprinopsis sp. MPI-PUGE-AT-0042]|nr:glycosyl hydrolase family 92-domain-containing protein [Coprinopsis sp. MPI-PUGE-AT-0042]
MSVESGTGVHRLLYGGEECGWYLGWRGWDRLKESALTIHATFLVPNAEGLIDRETSEKMGFVKGLEQHSEGHNDHTNEPFHHIPDLESLSGAVYKAQGRVREIAKENYMSKPNGLSSNEDCGQMNAWFMFSAMGF